MPALVAVDPGEAVLRIAAGEEAFDDVLLDAAAEAAGKPTAGRFVAHACIAACIKQRSPPAQQTT